MTAFAPEEEQELLDIRKTIIIAIASDDELMERLVLKGGNALDLIYELGERSSLDVDFSMAQDFSGQAELDEMRARMFRALRDRFDSLGYVLFDDRMEERPRGGGGPGFAVWGGYNARFKLIRKERYRELGGVPGAPPSGKVLENMRRQAQVSGPGFERVFLIEISKFEYTEGRVLTSVDHFDCYVYTPAMIAAEKLRAICQQLSGYPHRKHPAPRPRDFYDIHTISTQASCDLAAPQHHELIENMFAAKAVPVSLIAEIGAGDNREFHAQQWTSVLDAVRGETPRPFDFYFDFVVAEGERLLRALKR
jgi:predicted nucleotidyltransferase component of viral defense system